MTGATPAPAKSASPAADTSFTITGVLFGVAAISPANAWAVGCSGACGKGGKTLILHWNGAKWSQVTSPKPVYGTIDGLAAVSADNVWAVGETTTSTGADDKTLMMHWNGKAWTRAPGVPVLSGSLGSVSVSGNSGWAIGGTSGLYVPLVMRLISNHWYVVPTEAPGDSILYGIAVAGGSMAWADGNTWSGGHDHGLVLRWNGVVWKPVTTPLHGPNNVLTGLAVGPAGAVWAVGYDYNSTFTAYTATSMLWNGKTWRSVSVGSLRESSFLHNVAFVPGGTAWAIGYAGPSAVILRWTGHAWIQVPNPDDETLSVLARVAATSPSNAWAVGYASPGSQPQTLILHWNGKTWS